MRVAGLAADTISRTNAVSREQNLMYFLQVLRDLVATDKIYAGGTGKVQKQFNRSKSISWMRRLEFDHARETKFTRSDFAEAVAGYLDDMIKAGGMVETAFGVGTQERIAYDIWVSLLTDKGQSNFEFLFNHGYVRFLARVACAADCRSLNEDERILYRLSAKLIETSKQTGMQIIGEMVHTPVGPPFAIEGSNMLVKLLSEVMHEMIGTLIQLPYFDVLKRRLLTT